MNPGEEQEPPPLVAGREPEPPQGGEIRARWAWVEASVWSLTHVEGPGNGLEGWPNAYFHAQGLLSLKQSLHAVRQSP